MTHKNHKIESYVPVSEVSSVVSINSISGTGIPSGVHSIRSQEKRMSNMIRNRWC